MSAREKVTGYFHNSSGNGNDGKEGDRVQNQARIEDGAKA